MSNEFDTRKLVNKQIAIEMLYELKNNLADKWYPLAIDKEMGGYFTNITCNWQLKDEQEKMIVTQARHVWVLSKFAAFFNNNEYTYLALHGFRFLKDFMWDKNTGGFFQMRSRNGNASDVCGYGNEKRTYGNAFGVYSLGALADISKNDEVKDFAKTAFNWIEEHAFDPELKGYFQFIDPNGKPYDKNSAYKTKAYDDVELGYKDQNSSIHLLEAYTELYSVWKDEILKEKLVGLLTLIRDVITTPKGYMNLFFQYDWTPVSFRNAPEEIRKANFRLDHVSFGHDYETAFLLLEASHTLGIENDIQTLTIAKKMVDHSLQNGFDNEVGGFYDEAYYFKGEEKCTIIKDTKNWWAQAEALNILLMMSLIFEEEEKYINAFYKQWNYVKTYLLDKENGDWYEAGLDKEPQFKRGPKAHIWKCTYHTGRALMNCITILSGNDSPLYQDNPFFRGLKEKSNDFISHWQETAKQFV